MTAVVASRLRALPLFWKLLVPYLTLMVVLGLFGSFFIVRNLSSRAQANLDSDLVRRSVDARSAIHDRELYLLESANLAANLEGMANAVKANDAPTASRLLDTVVALKTDLYLVAVTNASGVGLAEFANPDRSALGPPTAGTQWGNDAFVEQALASPAGDKAAGYLNISGTRVLAIAAGICSTAPVCHPVGVAIVAFDLNRMAREISGPRSSRLGVGVYGPDSTLLASSGGRFPAKAPAVSTSTPLRRTTGSRNNQTATLFGPVRIQGQPAGELAVSVPTSTAFGGVRAAALRLALIVALAMLGIVGIGALLSRLILAPVGPLLNTTRALGQGELSTRVVDDGDDELGELARGVNHMADALEASYNTMEAKVDERTAEIARLLKERTQFFAGLSHEFRTPVAVILAHAKMLNHPDAADPKIRAETAKALNASGEQLLAAINDILTAAQSDTAGVPITLDHVSVAAVAKDLRPTLDGLAKGAGLTTKVTIPRNLPAVHADPARLREVLINLIDNAVKYTPAGGSVELAAVARNGSVDIAVTDTGVGIPSDAASHIFEPFYRVEGTNTQRGQPSSGLGLAITKRLVEAQGGTIDVDSEPGHGTTVIITLPLAPAKTNPPEGEEAHLTAEPTDHPPTPSSVSPG